METGRFKLFGTWKNRLTPSAAMALTRDVVHHVGDAALPFELSFCPPRVALQSVAKSLPPNVSLTAQNLVWDDKVSFTGETSADTLTEVGCRYVILGHSERRIYLGEDDSI